MSAPETIAAAIEKLEKLKAAEEMLLRPLTQNMSPTRAEFASLGSRTIDAQLEILRDAARAWADPLPMPVFGGGDMRRGIYHFHEQLALAILGRPS